ncbi:unnamed protein product [Caretta caretta]
MAGKKAALAEKEVEDSFSNRKELQQLKNASGISMKELWELKINLRRSIALQGWRECHAQISEPGQTNAHTSDYDPGAWESHQSLQADQYQEPVSQTKKGSNVDASSHVINIQGFLLGLMENSFAPQVCYQDEIDQVWKELNWEISKIATLLVDLGMHRALMVEQNSC